MSTHTQDPRMLGPVGVQKVDADRTMSSMASAITKLRKIARVIESRPQVIDEARREGETWEAIADALGMSRAGVIKLYNASKEN